jgi:hypothetical protein
MTEKSNLEIFIKEHTVERERLLKLDAINDFYKSLINSTKACGGCTDWITPDTTVKELADALAVNDVRFYYVKQSNQRGI